jgi:hypothetical protein
VAVEEVDMLWESDSERKPWETDGDLPWLEHEPLPWEQQEIEFDSADNDGDESWRGASHLADWPEEMAGPEYWLYKRMVEREV